ncbi:MAG: glutamine-hydrolyzing carbamoyl-phosphate synthase small subunit, partial [Chitinophagales bacterium]|nr:glutamine-hydrolyzing carbamoyl-phosphate synthase small subunit [Chitinophagales bacterium]
FRLIFALWVKLTPKKFILFMSNSSSQTAATTAYLLLEDGTLFKGKPFGKIGTSGGELCFNTGMTGYQEVISDLSYSSQIVCMTYPLIGNYGINPDDFESISPAIKGFVVKELCDFPSNFRSQMTLDEFFKKKNLSGIQGVDTRRLTRILRDKGVVKGKIVDTTVDAEEVIASLKQTVFPSNLIEQVSTKTAYTCSGRGFKVVLVDFGAKLGIIRELSKRNCNLIVVPHTTSAEDILLMKPDGVMLTNGPGDPQDYPYALEMIRGILGKIPVFGICMGHQLIGLACGAKTYKLKFGHRGGNHPVLDLKTNKVSITSQNHGYAIDQESLKGTDLIESHIALNDRTNEGLRHKNYPCFTVQYHPESSPGPEDANYLFDDFITMMDTFKKAEQYDK